MRAASALTEQEPCQTKKPEEFRPCRRFAAKFSEAGEAMPAKPTRQYLPIGAAR
jgi:hypothetical protein